MLLSQCGPGPSWSCSTMSIGPGTFPGSVHLFVRSSSTSWQRARRGCREQRKHHFSCGRHLSRVVNPSGFKATASFGQASRPEQALRNTVEMDLFIDKLRECDSKELPKLVAENIFSFDQSFWLRLATRAESCSSPDEQKDFVELSSTIMQVVQLLVQKTQENIDSSTDKLAEILQRITKGAEEIVWPPESRAVVDELKMAIDEAETKGTLDEGFLASVSALLRQTTEMNDRPGLVALLQKILQIYAATRFSRRSYAVLASGETDEAERLLETVLLADEENWAPLITRGIVYGGGPVTEEELFAVMNKRLERMMIRTESGSYEQRILGEYLKEIEARARSTVDAFKSSPAVSES